MTQLVHILKPVLLLLLGLISVYALALLSLTNSVLQRGVLYSHAVRAWWIDVNKPEQFGFAKNQVTPFNFTTTDGEILYAWHVLPLGLYARHESEVLQQPAGLAQDISKTKGFQLLQDDPDAKLVVIFHGNAGDVSQGWRTDSYRSLSDGSTSSIHILAFDYRGFGLSTGNPTEGGLILDGIAAVTWAIEVAKVPPSRIVLLGQSLGTAVLSAVVEDYAEKGIEFAGVILVAGFTNLPNLLLTYSLAGYVPLLGPLAVYPKLYQIFVSYLQDTWQSTIRLASFVRQSKRLRLTIIHSVDDFEIPWTQSEVLFSIAANATLEEGMDAAQIANIKAASTVDMGNGAFTCVWDMGNNKVIREDIVAYGYHSRVLTYAPVSLAVLKAFATE